ncbi:MAG: hypothetical protein IK125_02060 [Lachnospiraceae bacterium]|nr:hypothetical protein [Lachnospiraceae bacterium]
MVVTKRKKITPSQIIVLLVVLVIYVGGLWYVVKMLHPSAAMEENDKQLGFCYDMFKEIKNKHTELGPFNGFTMDEATKTISTQVTFLTLYTSENTNWLDMSRRACGYFTEYLSAHPEHRLITEGWTIELDLPSVIYRNVENGEVTGANFYDATYVANPAPLDYSIPEFLESSYLLGNVHVIHIESSETGLISNPEKTLSDIKQLKTLKKLELMLPDVPASLIEGAKEAGIEIVTK